MIKTLIDRLHILDGMEQYATVRDSIEKGVIFKGQNLFILMLSILIASLGLNMNSTAVIIGAMLISPLMGPIMGMGFALAVYDVALLRRSLYFYGFATLVGLVSSTLYFSITPITAAHSELLARTSPNVYDVLIAFIGGLAGMLALSYVTKGNVITGVAIATALMPPLCTGGYGLATGQWDFFLGAFYLYIINSVFIALATFLITRLLQFPFHEETRQRASRKARLIVLVVTFLTLIPSIYFGYLMVLENRFSERATHFAQAHADLQGCFVLQQHIDPKNKTLTLVYGGASMSPTVVDSLHKSFREAVGDMQATLIVKQGADMQKLRTELAGAAGSTARQQLASMKTSAQLQARRQATLQHKTRQTLLLAYAPQIVDVDFAQYTDSLHLPICLLHTRTPIGQLDRQRITQLLKLHLEADSVTLVVLPQ